jgi:hypothetical protein
MRRDFSTNLTSWLLIVSPLMLWLGWTLLPFHIGTYFGEGDFAAIHEHWRLWIWMYRVHIFGYVTMMMAMVAFGAVMAEAPARVLVWPGISVAVAGLLVSALASAFYYHHGAWGANEMADASPEALRSYVAALRLDTEYVTCLVRFGRVFFGLGLLVFGLGCLKWKTLPQGIGITAVLLGLAAMALTMGLPDDLDYYAPLFHLNSAWFIATGVVVGRSGLPLDSEG